MRANSVELFCSSPEGVSRFEGNVFFLRAAVLVFVISLASCGSTQKQIGIPPEVQARIDVVKQDIATGQDEKIYKEAAAE